MAVKIRLQRHGKKGKPFYHIVVADSRSKRDGKFIEKLGTYNPNVNPAAINVDIDEAVNWLQKGAQPSDTCRAILSYKGVMYKNHLLNGVRKGAFAEAEVEKRFESWLKIKESKIAGNEADIEKTITDAKAKAFANEQALNEAKALEILAKNTPLVEEVAVEEAAPEAATEEAPAAEATEEAPAVEAKEEAPAAEVKEEAPAAEAKEEAPAAEAKEEAPAAEAKEEAPAAEVKEEAPAAEAKEEAPAAEAKEEAKKED